MAAMTRLIAAIVLAALAGGAALGDGFAVVSGSAKVRIPDQSALIVFDGTTERLVIETSIESDATDLAWVVPLPALPKIEPVTAGVFPTLRAITRPRVRFYTTMGYGFLVLVTSIAFILWVWWSQVIKVSDGFVVTLITLLSVFWALLLPAGGSAGSMGMARVAVLQRNIVGAYETATISGQSGTAIRKWLADNGYSVPAAAVSVMDDYARQGWVFAAARLRRGEGGEHFAPHPLSFTFPAKQAVYPLRLTAIESSALDVVLYVAAAQEARAENFKRERTGWVETQAGRADESYWDNAKHDDSVPIYHEELARLVNAQRTLTVLSARLTPKQMRQDALITWQEPAPYRKAYYLYGGAFKVAIFSGFGVLCLLSPFVVARFAGRLRRKLAGTGLALSLAALVAGIIFISLPKLPPREVVSDWPRSPKYVHESTVSDCLRARQDSDSVDAFRERVRKYFGEPAYTNPWTGAPWREEDSPGSYLIEDHNGRAAYFYFDENGAKIELPLDAEKLKRR